MTFSIAVLLLLCNPSEAIVRKMDKKSTFNGIIRGVKWIDLGIPAAELRPDSTLIFGQCNSCDNFNWKRIDDTDEKGVVSSCWIGMLDSQAVAIRQTDTSTLFADLLTSNLSIGNNGRRNDSEIRQLLRDYFQTGHNLEALYSNWNEGCVKMKLLNESLQGVRILRQAPFECLISFICSTNNNINRISIMLDRLRCRYGRYICTVTLSTYVSGCSKVSTDCWRVSYEEDNGQSVREELARALGNKEGESSIEKESTINKKIDSKSFQKITSEKSMKTKGTSSTQKFSPIIHHLFEFPTIETLALASEMELMTLGMGYRAKFIRDTALLLAAKKGGGKAWLNSLRNIQDEYVDKEKVIKGVKRTRNGCTKEERGGASTEGEKGSSRLLVRKLLMEFPGVGPKVADCVALFSLVDLYMYIYSCEHHIINTHTYAYIFICVYM
jgi:3-methyladenine DNA glycosylase/8-oxoguanine DNA glycosylase